MDRLEAMEVFVRIVQAGSFSAVAREMGTTQPTISKQITALETHLRTRLLNRSTRNLSLTEAGTAYYERCKRILEDVKAAEGALGRLQSSLTGVLHVNGAIAMGQIFLTPLVLDFQRMYPDLTIELTLNDRYIDLVEEGVDVAVRLGRLADSNLIARPLGQARRVLVATRDYLDRFGRRACRAISVATIACSTRTCRAATSGGSAGRRVSCACRRTATSRPTTGTRSVKHCSPVPAWRSCRTGSFMRRSRAATWSRCFPNSHPRRSR